MGTMALPLRSVVVVCCVVVDEDEEENNNNMREINQRSHVLSDFERTSAKKTSPTFRVY